MKLRWLQASQFRNLSRHRVEWDDSTNLIVGPNGAGKTNLLEALGVLGTLRSFRGVSRKTLPRHDHDAFLLEGEVSDSGQAVDIQQVVTVRPQLETQFLINGAAIDAARYLYVFPLTAISMLDRELVVGAPAGRRRFLDRLAFLIDPTHLEGLRTYRRLQQHRNAMLHKPCSAAEMESWEHSLSVAAAGIVLRRLEAAEALGDLVSGVLTEMTVEGFPSLTISYRYDPWLDTAKDLKGLEIQYQTRYNESRARDRDIGFTIDGPHRHDLSLRVDGHLPKDVLSSGQIKVVGTALKLAAHIVVERQRVQSIPIAIDDVDAELDTAVLDRFLTSIGESRQLFLTSAHEELICERLPKARRFSILDGSIEADHASERGDE